MNMILGRIGIAAAAIPMLALTAMAQNQAPLSGPSVTDRAVPGTAPTFTEPEQGKLRQREIPIRAFQQALIKAIGPDAPADVRASDQVHAQIRKLLADFRKQMESSKKENRAAPKPSDTYAKVWTLLNPKQKEAVEAKIEEFRHQQDVRQGEEYVKRRLAKTDPSPSISGQKPGSSKEKASDLQKYEQSPNGSISSDFIGRIMRAFEQMTPAERERILTRIEGMLAERQGTDDPKKPRQDAKSPQMDQMQEPQPKQP